MSIQIKKALSIVTIGFIVNKGLFYFSNIILMFLFAPGQMASIAIIMSFLWISLSLTSIGTDAVIISSDNLNDELLSSVWFVEFLRYTLISILLLLSNDFIIDYFNLDNSVSTMLPWLSLYFIISCFRNVGIVVDRKNLKFEKIIVCEFLSTIVNIITTLSLAYIYNTVWCVLLGYISGNLLFVILTNFFYNFNHLKVNPLIRMKDVLNFSSWVFLNTIQNSIMDHGITLYIGKISNPVSVSFYDRVDLLTRKFGNQFAEIGWKFGLPFFAANKDSKVIVSILSKTFFYSGFLVSLYLLVINILATQIKYIDSLILWSDIVNYIPYYSFVALIGIFCSVISIYCQSLGKVKFLFFISTFRFFLFFLSIFIVDIYDDLLMNIFVALSVSQLFFLFTSIFYFFGIKKLIEFIFIQTFSSLILLGYLILK